MFFIANLNFIIAPEIKDDAFAKAIYRIVSKEEIHSILEIGSSSGEGSTAVFARAIEANPFRPTLFCIEASRIRYEELKRRYQGHEEIHCYQVSSVPLSSFPPEEEVTIFYQTTPTTLNQAPLEMVLGWLAEDKEYLIREKLEQKGIEKIKKDHGITQFDLVLIDGSEFTGKAELGEVYGAKYILLDDVNAFKNYENRQTLLRDPNYFLVEEDLSCRNGYSIFRRITLPRQPQLSQGQRECSK